MPLKLYRLKAVVFTLGLENKGSYENAEQSLQKHFDKHGEEVGAKDPQ